MTLEEKSNRVRGGDGKAGGGTSCLWKTLRRGPASLRLILTGGRQLHKEVNIEIVVLVALGRD